MAYDKMGFETKICNRCGGNGHYSYCQAYGSRCFKCGGKGYIYSAKGISALNFFRASLEISAKDVKVSMFHRNQPGSKWFPILEVEDGLNINGDISYKTQGCTYNCGPESKITAINNMDDYKVKLIEAIRFQTRLTKAGKEMKKYLKKS